MDMGKKNFNNRPLGLRKNISNHHKKKKKFKNYENSMFKMHLYQNVNVEHLK